MIGKMMISSMIRMENECHVFVNDQRLKGKLVLNSVIVEIVIVMRDAFIVGFVRIPIIVILVVVVKIVVKRFVILIVLTVFVLLVLVIVPLPGAEVVMEIFVLAP